MFASNLRTSSWISSFLLTPSIRLMMLLRAELNCEIYLFTASIWNNLSVSSLFKKSHNNWHRIISWPAEPALLFRAWEKTAPSPVALVSTFSLANRACLRSIERREKIAPVLQVTKTALQKRCFTFTANVSSNPIRSISRSIQVFKSLWTIL